MTSRTESSHYELKAYLKNRHACLFDLHSKIWEMVLARRLRYRVAFEKEHTTRRVEWDTIPILQPLIFKVGWVALAKIAQQARYANDEFAGKIQPSQCSQAFTQQWGLPCRHQISHMMTVQGPLGLNDLDPHWWLKAETVSCYPSLDIAV